MEGEVVVSQVVQTLSEELAAGPNAESGAHVVGALIFDARHNRVTPERIEWVRDIVRTLDAMMAEDPHADDEQLHRGRQLTPGLLTILDLLAAGELDSADDAHRALAMLSREGLLDDGAGPL